ncbi:MAG: ParB/RepB/Spo0J family partition protein [Variovorax sp.]|nr:ParB/RepB/Spo0J family partition protein [Variovorax sp.]
MPLTEFAADTGTPVSQVEPVEEADQFAVLELDAIVASLTNRKTFDEVKMAELADSIKASGVHQAILVRPLPLSRLDETSRKLGRTQRATHEIVSGERRWRASKLAGKTSIPAVVRRLTDAQALEIQIIENLQREGLTELEEAEGFQRLVDETSVAKESIGEKIGKSRAYVYARLKLLDLNTAGREALRRGEIDASKALLVARIPDDKLQIKALGQAAGSDNYGRALSVKELQAWLQTNVMLSLKRTSFDITDVTLRDGAGACGECPKRTGANPDLFTDVESADLCTDPACYHDKERATAERRFEAAQREGKKVIDQEQAAKMVKADSREWLKGHYQLDQYPDYTLDVDGMTLRKALGKHCPEPVLVKHPETGDIVEVLPIDQVKRIIREQRLTRFEKHTDRREKKDNQAKAEQQKLPIEKRPEFSDRWQKAAILRAVEFIKSTPVVGTPDLLRAWLIDEGENDYEADAALQLALELEDRGSVSSRIASTPDEEVPRLFMLYMLHRVADRYNAWSDDEAKRQGPRSTLFEIMHMAGINVAEVQAEAMRAMESEERAAELELQQNKAVEKAPKPAKAQKLKKTIAQPAAPARKPTKEKVQRDIADAFQALEDGAEKSKSQAPDGAKLDEGAALAAPDSPTFNVGDIARVKADSKSPGGRARKTAGRVGRIAGTGDDGRIHLRYGPRSHELVVVKPEQLEHYKSDPLIGSKVRVVSTGEYQWKQGVVERLREDGWGIAFEGEGTICGFISEELEVMA